MKPHWIILASCVLLLFGSLLLPTLLPAWVALLPLLLLVPAVWIGAMWLVVIVVLAVVCVARLLRWRVG